MISQTGEGHRQALPRAGWGNRNGSTALLQADGPWRGPSGRGVGDVAPAEGESFTSVVRLTAQAVCSHGATSHAASGLNLSRLSCTGARAKVRPGERVGGRIRLGSRRER